MTAVKVDRLDLRFVPKPWRFAQENRAEIDGYFAQRRRAQPQLWNGRVLMLHDRRIEAGVMHGAFLEIDYASFLAWREWGLPPAGVWDCFGAAAVVSSDGAVLLGEMGPHTANAGKIYFPCGTPDPADVAGETVDFEHSIARELSEETGLKVRDFTAEPGWTIVEVPSRLAAIKVLRAPIDAVTLAGKVRGFLARQAQPELTGVRMVRGVADIDPAMPGFVSGFLQAFWR
jgi:hypothetical protein